MKNTSNSVSSYTPIDIGFDPAVFLGPAGPGSGGCIIKVSAPRLAPNSIGLPGGGNYSLINPLIQIKAVSANTDSDKGKIELEANEINIKGPLNIDNNTVTAQSFTATSDKNKKENIETISDATSKIESLRGVSYNLKTDNTKTHYGVVAQELEEVFPDMVHGEEGNKSVAYMEIIGVLIETVKDLNKRVKILEQTSNN